MRDFLASIVDYAGLFPPAELGMAESVREYAGARSGPDRWALGRFVVPAARLPELRPLADSAWELSVIVDRRTDVPGARALETKASAADQIWTSDVPVFFEIPVTALGLLAPIARAGGRAKIRMAVPPSAADLARFLRACAAEGVPFKATAGLHHPLRHREGHGFLNLLLAAALAKDGGAEDEIARLLDDGSREAFAFEGSDAAWRGRRIPLAGVRRFALSFGSCSFREPLDHLRELGFL